MIDNVLISKLDWQTYDRYVRETSPVVLLPVGSLEQHGPHLPLDCDSVIPTAISQTVAPLIGGLVAPTISYGYKSQPKSGGGQHFSGTTSLDAMTLIATVRDVIKEFARHGVRKMALLIGHYENTMFVIEGIDLALRDLRADGIHDMKVLRIDYWDFTSQNTLVSAYPEGFPGWPLEHAGVMETSVMLHLHPEFVHMDRCPTHGPVFFPAFDVYPFDPARGSQSGALSSAKIATPEKGRMMFEEYVSGISEALREEFALSLTRQRSVR
ncbi:MAG: creatininase [Dongiaceae bacterium]